MRARLDFPPSTIKAAKPMGESIAYIGREPLLFGLGDADEIVRGA